MQFIIKCDIGRVESSISKILLPANIYLVVSSLFNIFISVKPELILLISSIICFTIFNIFDEKNKKDNLNKVFEISAYILVLISSFIIILFESTLTSFILNEFLWIYYFLYTFIKKKNKSESIAMFSISIVNLILCSISLDIKLYYVILSLSFILTVIYVLSSKSYYQSEQALSSVTQKLQDESNEVKYLDILTSGSVPEDCNCLVITTLKEDLNELERDKILEYIKNGGKILMLTSQNVLNVETPNLNAILAEYGISINFGAVFEQDTSIPLTPVKADLSS